MCNPSIYLYVIFLTDLKISKLDPGLLRPPPLLLHPPGNLLLSLLLKEHQLLVGGERGQPNQCLLYEINWSSTYLCLKQKSSGLEICFTLSIRAQGGDLLGHEINALGQLQELEPECLGVWEVVGSLPATQGFRHLKVLFTKKREEFKSECLTWTYSDYLYEFIKAYNSFIYD